MFASALATALTAIVLTASSGWAQNGSMVALLAADRAAAAHSEQEGAGSALLASLASDGALLWPGAPVLVEKPTTRRVLSAVRLDSATFTWQPLGAELSADSTLGMTWGISVHSSSAGADRAPRIRLGRYLAAWRRTTTRWELAAIAFTGPAAPPVESPSGAPLRLPPLSPSGQAATFVAADLAFARLAGDSGAAAAFERWAAPAAILPGSILAVGPAAIGRAIRSGGRAAWRWHPVLAWSTPAADFGFTVGEATIVPDEGDTAYSKYLTVWRRLADGSIRFIADGGNPRPNAP